MLGRVLKRHRRPRIGYALGGGAVRGAAHVGFLSVFRDAGIEPHCIAGTSAGAIVGALYAAGLSIEEMSTLITNTGRQDLASISWKRRGLSVLDATPLSQWIEQAIGDIEFKDLRIPLAAVACNIVDGHEVVLREGPVIRAAVASAAIPGLFRPVEQGEMLLVDGGLVNNLPVSVTRDMGAEIVVAVDLSPRMRRGRRPENLRDVVTASVSIAGSNTQVAARKDADYLVQPDIEQFSMWDFAKVPLIEEAGRQAALPVVEQVLAALE